jgi:hypothetical protein
MEAAGIQPVKIPLRYKPLFCHDKIMASLLAMRGTPGRRAIFPFYGRPQNSEKIAR